MWTTTSIGLGVAFIVAFCMRTPAAALCKVWTTSADCIGKKNDGGCECLWRSSTSRCYTKLLVRADGTLSDKCSETANLGGTNTCPYSANDACMNERNLEQCRYFAGMCGSQMRIMESCPLQFACPCPCGESCDKGTCLEDGVTCGQPVKTPDCPEPLETSASLAHVRIQSVQALAVALALLHVGRRFNL
eukprot:TRINITY_DN50839_c0_g1_i1.p1 TRINITY_DN50839_c0_g1~~TRINITY_DN50839_c0_g1_i1.p1  ORF type:complete len:190 (+),score=9.67 TRINITY_DN50839_c0_g1_i1:116-685(+)